MTSDEWPHDRLEALILLAKDGYSAREIVDRLWLTGFKVTRNAVLGKANRHNIQIGAKSKGILQSQRFGRKGRMPATDMPPTAPMPNRGCCQWPLGDVWCGDVVCSGVYCKTHNSMAYTGESALTIDDINFLIKVI